MKKILIALTIVISCLGINRVNAETINLPHSDVQIKWCTHIVTDFNYLKELGYIDEVEYLYQMTYKEYVDNYSLLYPYFSVSFTASSYLNCNQISSFDKVGQITLDFHMFSEIPTYGVQSLVSENHIKVSYDVTSSVYTLPEVVLGNTSYEYIFYTSKPSDFYNPFAYFTSNFDLINNTEDTYVITGNSNFTINPGDVIKPIFTAENVFQTNYIEINLNDYAYVALSLKDYTKDPFETTIQVKGEYCVNAVYDYGLSAKEKYDSSVTDICSPYYDNYTPVRHYVLENDIKNHAIYYLKAHDTTRENTIKVDSSIFNIHYITEEEADNPIININGRDYSILPFDELPSNSIKNTEEGNWPGASEEFSFADIFTAPLDFLMEIWGTITTFFSLITSFILLLPPVLQGFLYSSFTLAIVLGLIKILIG